MKNASIIYCLFITLLIEYSTALLCNSPCLTCSLYNPDYCTTCLSTMIPSSGKCSCPDGSYAPSGILTSCSSCDNSCTTCIDGSTSGCTSCPQGSFLYLGACRRNCSSQTYFNQLAISCSACNPNCFNCTGPASNQCTSCSSGSLIGGSCLCPSGYFKDSSYICRQCNNTCKECSDSTSNDCTLCYSNFILQSGKCICSTGKYMNLTSITCSSCYSQCYECTGPSSSSCLSCPNNLMLSSGSCLCPTRTFFLAALTTCVNCYTYCQECSNALSTGCTSCRNNLTLLTNHECGCQTGAYLDPINAICIPCHPTCAECSGPLSIQCTNCTSLLTLITGQCFCLTGYFDFLNLTCQACNPTCSECSGPNFNQCTSCRANETLSSGQCVANSSSITCPIGYFYNSSISNCSACYIGCLSCNGTGQYQCLSCMNNLVLTSNECSCLQGEYFNSSIIACSICHPSCNNCLGPSNNQCTSCNNNMVLSASNTCGCSNGSYTDIMTYSCISCHSSCSDCFGVSSNQCSSCKNNMILSNLSTCGCSNGSYTDLITYNCNTCHSSCQECSGSGSNNCTSCFVPNILSIDHSCYEICSSSEFKASNGSCLQCDSTCTTCMGPGSQNCTLCALGKNLINGQCISTGCHSSCQTCSGLSELECTSCGTNLSLLVIAQNKGQCLMQCPRLFYMQTESGTKYCQPKTGINNRLTYGGTQNQEFILMNRYSNYDYNAIVSGITVAIKFTQSQPLINYLYSFKLSTDRLYITITLTFDNHLLPGSTLTLAFEDFKDDNSTAYYLINPVQYLLLDEYYPYSESTKKAENATTRSKMIISQANSVFSKGSSFLSFGVHSMRSQVVEDMISFFFYMNIRFPPNFISFANNSQAPSDFLTPNFISSLFSKVNQDMDKFSVSTSDSTYNGDKDLGYSLNRYVPSRRFLTNFGSTISLFIICFLSMFVLEGLRKMFPSSKIPVKRSMKYYLERIFNYFSYSLRWNFMINQYMSIYIELTFYSLLQIANGSPFLNFEFIAAIFGSLFSFFGIFVICYLSYRVYLGLKRKAGQDKEASLKQISSKKEEEIITRLQILHEEFNSEKLRQLAYPLILIARSYGFIVVIVFLYKIPLLQVLYTTLSTVFVICYLRYYNPFDSKAQNILTLLYEFLFLAAGFIALVLHLYNKDHIADIKTRSNLGFAIIACNIGMLILDIVSMMIELRKLGNFFRRSKKIANHHLISSTGAIARLNQNESQKREIKNMTALSIAPADLEGKRFLIKKPPTDDFSDRGGSESSNIRGSVSELSFSSANRDYFQSSSRSGGRFQFLRQKSIEKSNSPSRRSIMMAISEAKESARLENSNENSSTLFGEITPFSIPDRKNPHNINGTRKVLKESSFKRHTIKFNIDRREGVTIDNLGSEQVRDIKDGIPSQEFSIGTIPRSLAQNEQTVLENTDLLPNRDVQRNSVMVGNFIKSRLARKSGSPLVQIELRGDLTNGKSVNELNSKNRMSLNIPNVGSRSFRKVGAPRGTLI